MKRSARLPKSIIESEIRVDKIFKKGCINQMGKRQVNPEMVTFTEEGEIFCGKLTALDKVEMMDPNTKLAKDVDRGWFIRDDGTPCTMILGSQLAGILKQPDLMDETLEIIYKGTQKSNSGRQFKDFDVFVIDDE